MKGEARRAVRCDSTSSMMGEGLKTMNSRKLIAALSTVLAACAALAVSSDQIFDVNADAHQQIRAAIAEAARTHRNVVLDFGANWCGDCHALEAQMHKPDLASLIAESYVVVNIDVGRFDKNLDLAREYHIPLHKGIPALAILDPHGQLLYSQEQGQFEDARHMTYDSIKEFFERWKPTIRH